MGSSFFCEPGSVSCSMHFLPIARETARVPMLPCTLFQCQCNAICAKFVVVCSRVMENLSYSNNDVVDFGLRFRKCDVHAVSLGWRAYNAIFARLRSDIPHLLAIFICFDLTKVGKTCYVHQRYYDTRLLKVI